MRENQERIYKTNQTMVDKSSKNLYKFAIRSLSRDNPIDIMQKNNRLIINNLIIITIIISIILLLISKKIVSLLNLILLNLNILLCLVI